ncbi:branched-chain amino acid transport system ATP-binding protein [Methanophagales archaeon]|nr:branched-chain amino acid transport system ATP-binding protein [Methanophagales archaeon]
MLLEVRDLTVHYGAVKALDNISLEVAEGEIVAMIGPNGAGKSTALNAISGLIKSTSGVIDFQGQSIKNLPNYDLVKKGVTLVPERRRVFTSMSVIENLEMGAYIRNDKMLITEDIKEVFKLFPSLKERQSQRAGTLSGGEQQMLAMGRALMLNPKLLLLDEPSLGLSPNYIDAVFERISEINKHGTTILMVEQNARMALEFADRGYVFKIGKIFLEDKAENLLKNEEIKKAFLGER